MHRPLVLGLALGAPSASAQDEFEIQVYDADTAPRGEAGLELHANYHLIHAAPDEAHLTLEPHYGLADWAELGGYLQGAVTSTGDAAFAGAKLRAKLRWPRRVWHERIGLAVNGELSAIPSRFESNVYGSELRPIADLRVGSVYASINPIVTVDLRGDRTGHPQFEPAAKLSFALRDDVAVGIEGYGAFGPIDDLGADRVLRGFAVVDLRGARWDLDAGVGVTTGGDHPIVKVIVGVH